MAALACSAAPHDAPPRESPPRAEPPPASRSTAAPAPAAPASAMKRIALTVRETAGVAREDEVATNGVPLPRSLGVRDAAGLAVVDPAGKAVPAEFRVLARWNAGVADATAPVQWLLVSFPATVAAHGSAVYSLVTDGSAGGNPAPARPLRVLHEGQDGRQVVVDTGAAVFRLGGEAGALFDEVRLGAAAGGRRLIAGSSMTATARALSSGQPAGHSKVRSVRVEHAGPLTAAVIVEGEYDLPPVGDGGFSSYRRYVFTAGSPAAVVRQAITWEGNLACPGCLKTKSGEPDGVLFTRVRDELALDPAGIGAAPEGTVTAVGAFKAPAIVEKTATGAAVVRQELRANRHEKPRFEVAVGGQRVTGEKADGGVLAVGGGGGTVAVALAQMHRYEPQALRWLENGKLAIDLADDRFWLAQHQGMFATLAVAALAGEGARGALDRLVWAPLNRPLRGWPEAAWWSASQAVEEIPAGRLPHGLGDYDTLMRGVLDKTMAQIDEDGIPGLMTFGLYPRYWGQWKFAELDCKNHDPTPGETWDDSFWCGSWTDYHDTVSTVPIWAMRSGEVEWLDELGFPGALRVLHTQVMQCGPDDRWFYCGQAPAGYGAYREDFNSSHAYFDNLFLYYWLTGDSTVVDTLRHGGENMRRLMCKSRGHQPISGAMLKGLKGPEGPACAATEKLEEASFTGRVAGQWLAAFRFLGLASGDASFLDDFRSGLARELTWQYAEVEQDGRRYGFLGDDFGKEPQPLDKLDKEREEEGKKAPRTKASPAPPGMRVAGPVWMNAFYDAENLYRYEVDSGDAPLGEPPVRPSQALAAVARTLADLVPRMEDGHKASLREPWPQHIAYAWSGPRLGGRLTAVEGEGRDLFSPEKAGMAALLVRAGQDSGDPQVLAAGREMVELILAGVKSDLLPLGKLDGQNYTRLHAAVARLAGGPHPLSPSPATPPAHPGRGGTSPNRSAAFR